MGTEGEHIPPVPPSSASSEAAAAATHTASDSSGIREKEPELPKFNGSSVKEYRTYKKKLMVWTRLTNTPPEKRALRILTALEDEAWAAVEDLDFALLETDPGPHTGD